jgi:hypothetical protein
MKQPEQATGKPGVLGSQIGLAPVRADRRRHYWRMEPSHKAMRREVDRIWEMTAPKYGWKLLPELIGELNRYLKGWANYYRLGQPRQAFQRSEMGSPLSCSCSCSCSP